MTDREVIIEIRGDIKDINAKLQGLRREVKKSGDSTKRSFEGANRAIKNVVGSVSGILAGFVSVRSAIGVLVEFSDTAFSMKATFGDAYDYMHKKAEEMADGTIYHVNEVEYAFTKTNDSMKRYGITGEKYINLVNRAMDIGASKNLDLRQSIHRLESAMRGEAEASEYLGVTLNDTYMKNIAFNGALKDSWEKLSDNEKAMYRYQELLKQTEKYVGKAGEATKTLGGSFKVLGNEIKDSAYFWLKKFDKLAGTMARVTLPMLAKENRSLALTFADLLKSAREFWGSIKAEDIMVGNWRPFGPKKPDVYRAPMPPPPETPPGEGGGMKDLFDEKAIEEAQKLTDEFEAAKNTYTLLELALRRGTEEMVVQQSEAEKLAEQYSEEFEHAKESVTNLDQAIMVSEATLTRMRYERDKLIEPSFFESFKSRWQDMTESAKSDMEALADVTAKALHGVSKSIGQAIVYGEDLGQSMRNVLKQIAADMIAMIIETQLQKLVSHLIGKATFMTETSSEAWVGVNLAAINAYKSTAAIPIVGPFLAPGAAAVAMANTIPLAVAAQAAAAAYGQGGISWGPEFALVGEEGPEAHIPLKGGKVPVDIAVKRTGTPALQIVNNFHLSGILTTSSAAEWVKEMMERAGVYGIGQQYEIKDPATVGL